MSMYAIIRESITTPFSINSIMMECGIIVAIVAVVTWVVVVTRYNYRKERLHYKALEKVANMPDYASRKKKSKKHYDDED